MNLSEAIHDAYFGAAHDLGRYHLQGILLGGLYALFAAGLSLVFGIMRLVNLAHGDLIVMGAYLILLSGHADGPVALCRRGDRHALSCSPSATDCRNTCSTACWATTSCRRCLSPSVCRWCCRTRFCKGFQPTASAAHGRAFHGLDRSRGLNLGVMPLLTFASALVVIVGLNQLFYRTSLGRAFRRDLRRCDDGQPDGHQAGRHFRQGHRHRDDHRHHRGALSRHAVELRSEHRPGAS
jgi:hypothetical protein